MTNFIWKLNAVGVTMNVTLLTKETVMQIRATRFARSVRSSAMVGLLGLAAFFSGVTPALAQPPLAALFIGPTTSQFRLAGSNETLANCQQTTALGVFASDPDGRGLGFPVFQSLGNNTKIVVIWNFGSAVPSNSLAAFNTTPTVTVPYQTTTTISATVFDVDGESTTVSFRITQPGCIR
jgi:hypothetical protein